LDVDDTSLGKILEGSNQYLVPLYQRPYSWGNKNWLKMWEDILELAEARKINMAASHFTGTLVLEASSVTAGLTKFVVVDGQQRLTTLSLLLAAITREWDNSDNEQAAKRIREQYLINTYAESFDARFRLRPANEDEGVYRDALEGKKMSPRVAKISQAFAFFQRQIGKLHEADIALKELEEAVLSGLKFVTITAKADDNVYRIFESINNTGVRLTQADLVRNFVFMMLGDKGGEVYESLWLPIVEGLASEDVETVFWIDAQWRDPEARKLDVYEVQKKHLRSMNESDVLAYLRDVLEIAEALRQVRGIKEVHHKELQSLVVRFRNLKLPGALVLATRILYLVGVEKISEDDAALAFKVLESYLVRRAIAAIPVNGLGRISAAVARDLSSDVPKTLHERLSTGKRKYVTDSEIRRIFVQSPIYLRGRRENVKLLIQWLLEEEQGRDSLDFDTMTIEHILPQKLSTEARAEFSQTLGPDDDVDQLHESLVHTIGNLTLTNYNSELSNSPFSVKRAERLLNTGVIANQTIAKNEAWGPDQILQRAEKLADLAVRVWSGPDESLLASKSDSVFDSVDEVLSLIEPGSWTTYGDIAKAVGTVGQVVGAAVSRPATPPGAWRVLRAGGVISPEFRWSDDSPYAGKTCQEVLESEGVRFENDKADESQRMFADELRELLDNDDEAED